ncbi:uncharacterized protein LOC130589874 [Beta vulgaris subsp. vulgaris]|uniref:uncharacterized protein LOC130589874 n=1 Tax=Beta vulgaris subsp. vulgaris TaxID=3555 RepID=UPI00254997B4|nr:uncharacterized protein LOC130589874 [Beta vulgaris subsp. vulgaris]
MEASTGRIPIHGEGEVQSARPANPSPSPETVQEESDARGSPDPSPSKPRTASDESNEAETSSNSASDSEEPSTTSSEIRRRLGPLSDPRYILADSDSAKTKLRKSWKGDMSSARFTDSLWKEYNKSGAEKRTDTLKNAPTSKALAEKVASKKRPATTGEAPPPKKSKGFMAKKKKPSRPAPKVVISIPAEDESPATEERAMIPYAGPIDQTPPLTSEQPEAVAQLDGSEAKPAQPDATLDGSAYNGPVAKLVGQMPEAYRTTSRSSGLEILAEEDDIPRYVHRLEFQESLHKANIKGEEPPVFQESSEDEEEEEVEAQDEENNTPPEA